MSNTRHLALFVPPPPFVQKTSAMYVDITSNMSAAGGQWILSSMYAESLSSVSFSASKNKIATMGIQIKSNLSTIAQVYRPAPQLSADCAFVFPFNRWNLIGHGTISASTQVATFPASNTQKQQRSKIWRSTSKSSQYLVRDLANPYRINSVCIVSHNLTSTGTFRVRIGNDSTFTANLYDSGTLRIWEPSFATSGLYEEEADAQGYPTNELIELLRYCGQNPRVVRWIVFDEVAARHVRIDFNDPDNENDFLEVAYIYTGLCIRVTPDQVYGWSIIPVHYSRIKRSASNSMWIDQFYRQVKVTAEFNSHPEINSIAFWQLLSNYLGRKREFIIAFQPDNLPKKFWFTLYGHFTQLPQIENIALATYNVPMEIEELPG